MQQFALAGRRRAPGVCAPTSIVADDRRDRAGRSARDSGVLARRASCAPICSPRRGSSPSSVRPATFSSNYSWSLSYVYANAREQYARLHEHRRQSARRRRGAGRASTRAIRSSYRPHLQRVRLDPAVGWYGSFRSGTPYTPIVGGDINGDGYANDRAFIFDPAKTADPALAAGMRALLATGSRSARDCLESQLGKVAARNSCEGPWTSTANLTFSFNPVKVRMPQRANLSFQISNPLGAADVLLHGEDHLHGWGQPFIPHDRSCSSSAASTRRRSVQVRGESALRRDGARADGDPRAGHAHGDAARRRRADARAAGAHADARSRPHDAGHEGAGAVAHARSTAPAAS